MSGINWICVGILLLWALIDHVGREPGKNFPWSGHTPEKPVKGPKD